MWKRTARRALASDRDERGAAMVEFAMILPLLVLLTFGIIEFGVAFNASSSVSQSSRAGGRTRPSSAPTRNSSSTPRSPRPPRST